MTNISIKIDSIPILQRGETVPVFTLPDASGRLVSRTSYRGRKHLVLLFVSKLASAENYLQELAGASLTVSTASGVILVVTRESDPAHIDQVSLPFSLLSDINGATTSRFLPSDVSNGLFIIDRYGELYYQALANTLDDLPPISEIIAWVEAIDNQCSI